MALFSAAQSTKPNPRVASEVGRGSPARGVHRDRVSLFVLSSLRAQEAPDGGDLGTSVSIRVPARIPLVSTARG